jgi:hypothetical protein
MSRCMRGKGVPGGYGVRVELAGRAWRGGRADGWHGWAAHSAVPSAPG